MTFLEAAIEVLRDADEALHFSEVAKRAVDSDLLSHVGRDPEAAMQTCLNSAVRAGRDGDEPILVREKPGFYKIRPGAVLPDPPPRPTGASGKKANNSEGSEAKSNVKPKETTAAPTRDSANDKRRSKRRGRPARGEAPVPASVEVLPSRTKRGDAEPSKEKPRARSKPRAAEAPSASEDARPAVEFEAPTGSGLDGITDVALVMANAMSRLVEERPELRDELDAMQHGGEDEAPTAPAPPPAAGAVSSTPARSSYREAPDDRGGRRRRRRRRRGKRVDWAQPPAAARGGPAGSMTDRLLDGVAQVLEESGPRSLHVRQVAETLANRGVLGGEISEIERAVTAAVLVDVQLHGRASRFVARGDARYQLQGTRLPDKAAKSEQSLRDAVRAVDNETRAQLQQWLSSLGARALESLVRIWLQREGFGLLAALPPSRGLAKLVAEDPDPEDDEGRTLVLVVPQRTGLDPSLWEGELERNSCSAMLAFTMGEVPEEHGLGDARIVGGSELASWLIDHGVGVQRLRVSATVLDPTLIESIGGLDT